jgi:hypothetical protein
MKLPNMMPWVKKALKPLDNELFGTTVRVALILYASLIAPELPDAVARQLDNMAVRSVLIFLIAYLAIKDPVTAALATLALMVTVMSLHRRDVQSVLGQVGSLAEKPLDFVGDVAEQALSLGADVVDTAAGVAGDVAETVAEVMGYDGAEEAPVEE